MVGEAGESYSSNQICDATGLRRTTLDAWILRRYLKLGLGPGTGRERRFSFEEVILIAVAAELSRLGLTASAATTAANRMLNSESYWQRALQESEGWTLVVAPSSAPPGIEAPSLSPFALVKAATPAKLRQVIRSGLKNPASVVLADVSTIVRQTRDAIGFASMSPPKGRPRKS